MVLHGLRLGQPMNETLIKLEEMAKKAQSSIQEAKDATLMTESEFPNGKPPRCYNQVESTTQLGPISSTKLRKVCADLGISHEVEGGGFLLEQAEINRIHHHLHKTENWTRPEGSQLAIWAVSQQKGGSGKTTLATTLATGLATECMGKYRILLLDLDPQGTATVYGKPNFNDDHISVGDLLIKNFDLQDGETYEDLCNEACYETNTAGLYIMGSREEDRTYEAVVEERRIQANASGEHYVSYHDLQHIVDAVQDNFDIIIIDTTPYFSAMTNAGHYVANNIIVPARPSENDHDGGAKHFSHLAAQYRIYDAVGHKGYNNIIIQPMAVETNKAHTDMISKIRYTYKSDCSPYNFVESKALTHCASIYSTIYDMSKSEYSMGTKESFRRAQDETRPIIKLFEEKTLAFWEGD